MIFGLTRLFCIQNVSHYKFIVCVLCENFTNFTKANRLILSQDFMKKSSTKINKYKINFISSSKQY